MTRMLTVAAAIALLLSPAAGSNAASLSGATGALQGAVEQELIALDKKFEDARRRADTAVLADLVTDEFLQATTSGVRNKAEALKSLSATSANAAPPVVPPLPESAYTVRVHGDTAVMTHVTTQADPHDPTPGVAAMHVFVRQQGGWKMSASSAVAAQPSAEHSINAAGYALIAEGKVKEAIGVLKMNVQLFPESWNVYDSLGEAYAEAGEMTLAIQNYEKSVQLNPANTAGTTALARLKKN